VSVRTEADDNLASAETSVRHAISNLRGIVIEQCWGYDQYGEEFTADIQKKIMNELISIRDRLAQ